MKKLMKMARQFRNDENGAAMIEYSILIGVITAGLIAAVVAVGVWANGEWQTLCTDLGIAANC